MHRESIHEGIKYPCPHCEYQATQTGRLKIHIESVHLGIKYPCDSCEYQATELGSLNVHIKRAHMGIEMRKKEDETKEANESQN